MSADRAEFETRCLSSLSKVFADEPLNEPEVHLASALWNETFSFQVAYRSTRLRKGVKAFAVGPLADTVTLRTVGLVPSELPIYAQTDDDVLRRTPGLYPDPLFPAGEEGIPVLPDQWRSVWVCVEVKRSVPAGDHLIEVVFESGDGERLGSETFVLTVVAAEMPAQQLIYTNWFHTDCLASHYGVEIWSEAHWGYIDRYIKTAAKHGMNMLLTPLFTPPLDTAVGGERPTVQLIDVEKRGDEYQFGFDKLTRWVEIASRHGIRYFEFSHLFTQWGAKHAPKVVARVDGERKRIFGWETDAADPAYREFLTQFLKQLREYIEAHGLQDRSWFHVSDEPSMSHFDSYREASEFLRANLPGLPFFDALSEYSFYETGLVPRPVAANDHIESFIEHRVPDLWTYYCCGQDRDVSNRFFAFPSRRNRVIGTQLYKFQISGFLHWGYNFWYTQYSRRKVDPFRETDAGAAFPSGDAFVVYPGESEPVESIRLEVFCEALQDLRAMQLLESLAGREAVLALLEEGLDRPLTFRDYPRDTAWLLDFRERVNRKIAELVVAE
ncbi:DUF4091 domain-containing protein [Cohnella pontilimi]|uniref:DUF4091 domain-containing protein n=1 Tax=Cohnella pontilimi TaxID=2564100 RepID=A0A4U0FA45_9BACL|nr:DUF4091 domain-containing protein [Cohnella pontilimi]TJY41500.1 DUF4091 domain-containing protein [Cohnella pontilimi]